MAALRPIIAMMPLSLYLKGFAGSALRSRRMFSAAHRPDCWATEPKLRHLRRASPPEGVRRVADGVDIRVAVDGQVGPDVEPSAVAEDVPSVFGTTVEPDSPPPHTTVRAGIVVLSSQNSTRSG